MKEGGRRFCLERLANDVGKYFLYLVLDLEAKRLCFVFLEGRGLLRGWVLLAEKPRSLGVTTHFEAKGGLVLAIDLGKKEKEGLENGEN